MASVRPRPRVDLSDHGGLNRRLSQSHPWKLFILPWSGHYLLICCLGASSLKYLVRSIRRRGRRFVDWNQFKALSHSVAFRRAHDLPSGGEEWHSCLAEWVLYSKRVSFTGSSWWRFCFENDWCRNDRWCLAKRAECQSSPNLLNRLVCSRAAFFHPFPKSFSPLNQAGASFNSDEYLH